MGDDGPALTTHGMNTTQLRTLCTGFRASQKGNALNRLVRTWTIAAKHVINVANAGKV
jgi:hypothetical protein